MKIAIRGGHNFQATGASALIDEVTENRKVLDVVYNDLKSLGHEVLNVTPGNCDEKTDLAYGVNKATTWGAEYFISLHFNKAFDSYNGALGSETEVQGLGGRAEAISRRILANLASVGFKNRGVKVRGNTLYELRETPKNMAAIIVEICFVEATEDVRIYKTAGPVVVGRLIAEGITGQKVTAPQPKSDIIYRVQVGAFRQKVNAEVMLAKLKAAGFDAFIIS